MKASISATCLLAALLATASASAQSTDGYHAIQIFPVVVDTASFAQRFNFTNPSKQWGVILTPRFFPGQGTAQAGTPLVCPDIEISSNRSVTVSSLRALCPALVPGSAFGFLHVSSRNLPFAAFSRVANPAGNGFTVEAFPAHTFTSADTVVNGIRRLAAMPFVPAFQTNCFMAVVNELEPAGASTAQPVTYTVFASDANTIGQGSVNLAPGSLVRLLDVFAAAGTPSGDYNDASVRFSTTPGTSLMSYCTVQDNVSFGADFRIGKQVEGKGSDHPSIGAQDDHVSRDSVVDADIYTAGDGDARPFSLADTASRNTHVIYFRHPDWVSCELLHPDTGLRVAESWGLEMSLFDGDGHALAGGETITGFDWIYLGDKRARNASANTRYTLEVRGNGVAFSNHRYKLHCASGSGHTLADMIRSQQPLPISTEVEPNDTLAQADAAGLRFPTSPLVTAAIGTNTDVDQVRGDIVNTPAVYRFETFAPSGGQDCTGGATTTLRIRDAAGALVLSDTTGSGIGGCGALVFPVEIPGTFYASVEETGQNGTIASYQLESRKLASKGVEPEGYLQTGVNDSPATATPLFGVDAEGHVAGDHSTESDADVYTVFVPAGKGLRAEIIEGDRNVETCESNGIDSLLVLLAADGVTQLVADDDDGRGFCSRIDGTGATPQDAAAKNTSGVGQTWYLKVHKSTLVSGPDGQFAYRLAISIR